SHERTRLWTPNSLLAGKIQGISSILASVARILGRNSHNNQSLTRKFPTHRNRELIGLYQGIKSAYQGNFLPDQGRVPWSGFSARFPVKFSQRRSHAHAARSANCDSDGNRSRTPRSTGSIRCPMPDVADVTGDLVDRGIGALSRAIDRRPLSS